MRLTAPTFPVECFLRRRFDRGRSSTRAPFRFSRSKFRFNQVRTACRVRAAYSTSPDRSKTRNIDRPSLLPLLRPSLDGEGGMVMPAGELGKAVVASSVTSGLPRPRLFIGAGQGSSSQNRLHTLLLQQRQQHASSSPTPSPSDCGLSLSTRTHHASIPRIKVPAQMMTNTPTTPTHWMW